MIKIVAVFAVLLVASSANAQTQSIFLLFPQIADGVFPDGQSYRSTLMVQNPDSFTRRICTLQLYGLTTTLRTETGIDLLPSGENSIDLTIPAGGWALLQSPGTQQFQRGYGTLRCVGTVYATLLYGYYLNGVKLSEAAVFGAESWNKFNLIADQTEGARLGIAIANDSDIAANYQITLRTTSGVTFSTTTVLVGPRSSLARFLDELIPASRNQILEAKIERAGGPTALLFDSAVIGIRMTGAVLTTIPAVRGPL